MALSGKRRPSARVQGTPTLSNSPPILGHVANPLVPTFDENYQVQVIQGQQPDAMPVLDPAPPVIGRTDNPPVPQIDNGYEVVVRRAPR